MTPLGSRVAVRSRAFARLLGWFATGAVLVAWFAYLAPTQVGGGTTFAVVGGHSMEPVLHTQDLVVARAAPSYDVGDLVVFRAQYSDSAGMVVHRIVAGNPVDGWITKGDNNDLADAWLVPNTYIRGRYWFVIAQAGEALGWMGANPVGFGALCAAIVLISYLPWSRLLTTTPIPRRATSPSACETTVQNKNE